MTYASERVPDPLGSGIVEVIRNSNLFGGANPPRRGKVRDVYDLGNELIIVTTDRVSAFDVVLPTLIPHKGESLHALSLYWFERTMGVFPNHLIEPFSKRALRVKKAQRIDIEWVLRAYLYGSAWRAYLKGQRILSGVRLPEGLEMAEELPETVLTPTTKSDVGHDIEISKKEAIDRGLVSIQEWNELEEACFSLFRHYRSDAMTRGIIIPDFKLEFGRHENGLIQIDEPPTHDSARFWDVRRYKSGAPQETHCLDKEYLREYLRRVGFEGEGQPPVLPPQITREVSKRCVASRLVFSGEKRIDDFDLRNLEQVMDELRSVQS